MKMLHSISWLAVAPLLLVSTAGSPGGNGTPTLRQPISTGRPTALSPVSFLASPVSLPASRPLDNGLARTPPMGWNSWNNFGCAVNEATVRSAADAMVSSGLKDAGYSYVNIDDCWQIARAADGMIIVDSTRFPHGIKPLADYVHSLGLKLGIYSDAGVMTCQGRPGGYGHEMQDAKTYADWGVDYLKYDWCYVEGKDKQGKAWVADPRPEVLYGKMRDALAASGRPIVFSLCNWGHFQPWMWGPAIGNLWRTTDDISDTWASLLNIADSNDLHAASAGPGHWNDPDMLTIGLRGKGQIGTGDMTDDAYRAEFSLWSVMAAPLIIGADVHAMDSVTASILLNKEVIAIDQDPRGVQGRKVRSEGGLEVWAKPLAADQGRDRAVVLFNRTAAAATIAFTWKELGLDTTSLRVRDLWAHADRGVQKDGWSAVVPSHGVVMVRVGA
ncbi:MAG: glycoside hydrolase family 27 protein [Gemmatimonadales bacterium]